DLAYVAGVANQGDGFLATAADLDPSQVDAVIDFSLPDGFVEILNWCEKNQKPLVSGTTGVTDAQLDLMKKAGLKTSVLWSPNMSLGVAVLRKALSVFSEANWFDFAIEEFHHNKKVDRPSGTALHLKKALEENIEREVKEVSALRGGGIYGVHSVFAMSEDEVLEFKHTALNRSVFASGAVKSCEWLLNQQPGVYVLEDVIHAEK
ncbi:MAG: 4-hydroxy-tetrahydrodipicolinate reductase, partial [Pseudomonadota bacterium]